MKTRTVFLALVLAAILMVASSSIYASHGTDNHWHGGYFDYQIRSSVPSGWHNAIHEAAAGWDDNTDMTLEKGQASVNWIEKGPMPGGHCSGDSAACAELYDPDGDHIEIVDITLNEDVDFGTSTVNCILDYPDVQETVAHEFGHAAGWLGHNTWSTSVMKPVNLNGCFRVPDTHDRQAMDGQIAGNH